MLVGVIVAVVAWFYRRGKEEQTFVKSLIDNTAANKEVAQELRDFKAVTVERLHDLDLRVTTLEALRVTTTVEAMHETRAIGS